MLQATIQTAELTTLICERVTAVLAMDKVRLDLEWAREYSPAQLTACCKRMANCFADAEKYCGELQQELIQNEDFASWLSQFRELSRAGDGEDSTAPGWSALQGRLSNLLKACQTNERDVTAYPAADVFAILELDRLSANACLTYLENYAPMDLSCEEGTQLVAHMSTCTELPTALTGEQKALLEQPFVTTRCLFAKEEFPPIAELFGFCPELADIAQLLHQNEVEEYLTLQDYAYFAEDAPEYHRLLSKIVQRLGSDAFGLFIRHWRKNGCTLAELRRMEGRTKTADEHDWNVALTTYSGYVNLLFGQKFKTISLSAVTGYQEEILTYAITHNKKGFIRLVDENGDLFFRIPPNSILYKDGLYKDHLNLNELTPKDLSDCSWMKDRNLPGCLLTGNRHYTFPELRLLYGVSKYYVMLYGKLQSGNLDYRLRVMRQLLKRDALSEIDNEAELPVLAVLLDQKPLHNWRQEDFGHVIGLNAVDVVRLLIHMDKLTHLLPGIRNRTDAMLALRSLDQLGEVSSMEALKARLAESDPAWCAMADDMGLAPEFKDRYRDSITEFLCQDGAGIAWAYAKQLRDDKQHAAFYRVVKAELMGRFTVLKYFEGDLERELGCPVPPQVKAMWLQNSSHTEGGMNVLERDDFFSTILLGNRPYETCLRYNGGAYCHCLLACFDSNKKVLYAERSGRIVGRACIRLTKCRITGTKKKGAVSQFDFVDLEDIAGSREQKHDDEWVTLFLERPYISDVGPRERREIEALFITFARQKAEDMGTMLVLSMDYSGASPEGFVQTRLSVYISASKAGEQYLDSLGGQASVSNQGSYGENRFLVDQTNHAIHQNEET